MTDDMEFAESCLSPLFVPITSRMDGQLLVPYIPSSVVRRPSSEKEPPMPTQSQAMTGAAAFLLGALIVTPTFAQTCTGPLRKINVGVAVAPPNVVHTAPYVAKALGLFARHCVEATIIQFDGGAAGTSVTAVAQGSAISNLPDVAIARGLKGKQIWGLAPRPPQAYVVPESVKTAADLKG